MTKLSKLLFAPQARERENEVNSRDQNDVKRPVNQSVEDEPNIFDQYIKPTRLATDADVNHGLSHDESDIEETMKEQGVVICFIII